MSGDFEVRERPPLAFLGPSLQESIMNVRSISETELTHHLPPDFLLRFGAENTLGLGVFLRAYLVPGALIQFEGISQLAV